MRETWFERTERHNLRVLDRSNNGERRRRRIVSAEDRDVV
jgi:hypothetical protein